MTCPPKGGFVPLITFQTAVTPALKHAQEDDVIEGEGVIASIDVLNVKLENVNYKFVNRSPVE